MRASSAAARAAAREQPSTAFAPSLLLFAVPSRSMRRSSIARWSEGSLPSSDAAISPFTFSTARRTPLPRYELGSPSRSSTASNRPVDAPEGTAARPRDPEARTTSTSTVGFPRESRIWRACTPAIALMGEPPTRGRVRRAPPHAQRRVQATVIPPPWRDRSTDPGLRPAERPTPGRPPRRAPPRARHV